MMAEVGKIEISIPVIEERLRAELIRLIDERIRLIAPQVMKLQEQRTG